MQCSLIGMDNSITFTTGAILNVNIIQVFTSFFYPDIIVTSNAPDVTPISLTRIEYGACKLRAKQRLFLPIEYDEESGFLSISKKELGINFYAKSRDNLIKELNEHLTMLWQQYASVPDKSLTKGAVNLKLALNSAFEEIGCAA